MADDAELCDHRQSNESETPKQPPQTSRLELTGKIVSLPGAVEALNAAIKKISITERDMKTLLEQTKSFLESILFEIDQHLEKAFGNVVCVMACSLCQHHSLQICQTLWLFQYAKLAQLFHCA